MAHDFQFAMRVLPCRCNIQRIKVSKSSFDEHVFILSGSCSVAFGSARRSSIYLSIDGFIISAFFSPHWVGSMWDFVICFDVDKVKKLARITWLDEGIQDREHSFAIEPDVQYEIFRWKPWHSLSTRVLGIAQQFIENIFSLSLYTQFVCLIGIWSLQEITTHTHQQLLKHRFCQQFENSTKWHIAAVSIIIITFIDIFSSFSKTGVIHSFI